MTHLEELKDALHSPPDFAPAPVDLAHVMAAGGRMRRRRAVAAGGAAVLTVAALLAGGSMLAGPIAGAPVAGPSAPTPSAENSSAPGVLGRIVETGKHDAGRQWVLYVETTDPDDLDRTLTLVLGHTRTVTIDDFVAEVVSGDPGAGRMKPGFHAVEAGRVRHGRTTPTFGYYVGDAASITARDVATGKTVEAHRTRWSGFEAADKMQIFWFDFAPGQPPAHLTDLTAHDEDGKELPAGG